MSKSTAIPVFTREANLKRRLRRHLAKLGFERAPNGGLVLPGTSKEVVRELHYAQRQERLEQNQKFVSANLQHLIKYFAFGNDIDPHKINPLLQRVRSNTWESDLFRLAALTWSVPVSNGFGRRLRYLVWDQSNEKLMGILAIGDPVFNLSVRDRLIGWSGADRAQRLTNILDAYVLGAIAPYNNLLCGKLVAALLRSREIYNDFTSEYGNTIGVISGEQKKSRLLAITTSSSMGRSSVYNRVKLDGVQYLTSIGYTGGWGHFHIPHDLFNDLRDYLREIEHPYADMHKFGEGPNWRLRTTRAALDELGFKADMLKHGIQREVFICQLASNSLKILKDGKGKPDLSTLLTANEVSALALTRWVIPRSESRTEYKEWTRDDLLNSLSVNIRNFERQIARTA